MVNKVGYSLKNNFFFFCKFAWEYKVISFSEFAWEYKIKSFSKVKVICIESPRVMVNKCVVTTCSITLFFYKKNL